MDQTEDQSLQAYVNQFKNCHFLKRVLQFSISFSLFSLFLCFSSGFSLCPNSFNAYFNTYLISFITHTFERKYMFLICNGILAFLVKSSVSYRSELDGQLSTSHLPILEAATVDEEEVPTLSIESPEADVALGAQGDQEREDKGAVAGEEAYEQEGKEKEENQSLYTQKAESEALIAKEEEEEEEDERRSLVKQEEDEVEGGEAAAAEANEELASTEELNRRFEEFIRKMKEEIRTEAQRQLIAV